MGRKEGNRAARLAKVIALVSLVGMASTGCSVDEVLRFGWPEGVTPQADEMRSLWTWAVVAALVVGVIVWGLILWSIVFHRKRSDSEELPRQFQYHLPLEIVLITVPTIIVAVLFYFTVVAQNFVNDKSEPADVNVNVVAFQWNWEFNYPGFEVTNPRTSAKEPVATIGSSTEIPLLVLPTNKKIRYTLTSNDVIHSFWVTKFNFKRDTFPHPEKNNQDNVFQNTIDRPGAFVGRCAELCGSYHSMMNFEVRALEPAQFERYMQIRMRINPATGVPYTTAQALTELNCGELCTPTAITTKPFDTKRNAANQRAGR